MQRCWGSSPVRRKPKAGPCFSQRGSLGRQAADVLIKVSLRDSLTNSGWIFVRRFRAERIAFGSIFPPVIGFGSVLVPRSQRGLDLALLYSAGSSERVLGGFWVVGDCIRDS